MIDRFLDRRPADMHMHECKDREDEACDRRGYCVCECGERRRFPPPLNQTRAGWSHE